MIYINKVIPQPVITKAELYELLVAIKRVSLGRVFVYLGYPYDKTNMTTFISLCLICEKGFIVSCKDYERLWCRKYIIQLMIKRNSLRNVYNTYKSTDFIHFVDPNELNPGIISILGSSDSCFDCLALNDAHEVFNRSFKIQ